MDNKEQSRLCEEEKIKGNDEYKAKNFNKALKHYEIALEYDPNNITVINNKAAVFLDQGKYQECVELCTNALKLDPKNKVERKTLAKTYYRLAKAYEKLNDLENSLKFYDYSIIEDRNPAVIKIAQKMELDLEEQRKNAYINFDISEEENQKGNQCFKEKDYNNALNHYTEAIKRSPNDVRRHYNRALCYLKMQEYTLSLQDAESCSRIDPTYIQAYLIKGKLFQKMRAFSKAHLEYEKALDIDSNCEEALKGYKISSEEAGLDTTAPEVVQRRIQRNPELRAILSEPEISKILYDMQNNPNSMAMYMKDPEIRKKINKLIACGLLTIDPVMGKER
ncbi:stress-induced-phosphoprotein 1-like [Octopus bimaculoides]|uniref:Stress-induced-phosphoprotein 1 n=1 Tax=Octopus bimaculoides TaxID=37653 RepID=A0A0L8G582_OCTBM|nr:stress-induced-phosphoprotein 1-like [Octopus bimaculoides]